MRLSAFVVGLMALSVVPVMGSVGRAETYPRAGLLVEPAALAEELNPGGLVVLDARPREAFEAARVPAARWVDHGDWSKSFEEGQDAEAWSGRIAALGLTAQSAVVVYDDNLSKDAARIWWILRYWGVDNVRLLNGGWQGWTTASLSTDTGPAATPEASDFQAQPRARLLATKQQLLDSLQRELGLQIVDSRSNDEHCGRDDYGNPRAGAIPGAKHLEWSDLLDAETKRFKPAAELSRLFEASGIDLARPTATHCQGGGRSSVMAFGMELMGAQQVGNYYRGFGEWSKSEETPIEVKQVDQNSPQPDSP